MPTAGPHPVARKLPDPLHNGTGRLAYQWLPPAPPSFSGAGTAPKSEQPPVARELNDPRGPQDQTARHPPQATPPLGRPPPPTGGQPRAGLHGHNP